MVFLALGNKKRALKVRNLNCIKTWNIKLSKQVMIPFQWAESEHI